MNPKCYKSVNVEISASCMDVWYPSRASGDYLHISSKLGGILLDCFQIPNFQAIGPAKISIKFQVSVVGKNDEELIPRASSHAVTDDNPGNRFPNNVSKCFGSSRTKVKILVAPNLVHSDLPL